MSAEQDVSSGLGSATGIALLGTIGSIAYRTTLTLPEGLSDDESRAASDSPGAAAGIAGQRDLPGGSELLTSIGESMSVGLHIALSTAAAVNVAVIVTLLVGLRGHTEQSTTA